MDDTATLAQPAGNTADDLLAIYDRALPQVFGYVIRRCGVRALAEDITSDVFMAAATALLDGTVPNVTVGWLIGTARHKIIDHWRRTERHHNALTLMAGGASDAIQADPNDEPISTTNTHEVLEQLSAEHRSALTLRYIDGLAVGEVADVLGRSIHATESILQRAKAAFRHVSAARNIKGEGPHDE